MKEQAKLKKRALFLLAGVLVVLAVFSAKLFQLQVVEGADYRDKATSTTLIELPLPAARGEIVDRYGRAIATNRAAYHLWLIKAMLPDDQLNEVLMRMVDILSANGESWNDDAPLTHTEPYQFEEGRDADVERMKSNLGLAQYATAQNVYDKMIDAYDLEDIPEEYQRTLAGIRYQMQYEEYSNATPFVLASDVSMKTVATVKENNLDLPGVYVMEGTVRSYPDSTLMPHIIGTVGKIYAEEWESTYKDKDNYKMNDLVGKSGIELAYESTLKGVDGKMQIELTRTGSVVSTTVVEPIPGDTVVLTIDKNLQSECQKILENQVMVLRNTAKANREGEAEGAALVVLDVKTGGVLAAATYPSYDLNLYSSNYSAYASDELLPLLNRAFTGLYRPGSTFKCAVAAEGLIEGLITPDYTYYCGGTYTYWSDYQPKCTHHHGNENVRTALQDSCNIFFYDLGRRLGLDAFNSMASTLGFGQKTGLEVGEATGNLSTPEYHLEATGEDWQQGNVVQSAIGQQDTQVTPVQLATYAGAIANNGTRYRTHLVAAIRSYDFSELIEETQVEVAAQVEGDPATIQAAFDQVEQGMLLASRVGTAEQFLGTYQYQIASKTGTAETGKKDEYGKNEYNATIVAYGPVEEPELAIGAVAEVAGNGYQLARSVRDVFDAYYIDKNQNSTPVANGQLLP